MGAIDFQKELLYDARLVYERRVGNFFLCIPEPLVRQGENQAPNPRHIVALDPGVRTFMTAYALPPSYRFLKGEKARLLTGDVKKKHSVSTHRP